MRTRSPWVSHLLAAAGAAAAALLRVSLEPLLEQRHPFVFFYFVIVVTALYLGFVASLTALGVSFLLAEMLIFPPQGRFVWSGETAPDLVLFTVISVGLAYLSDGMRRTKQDALQRAEEAQDQRSRAERELAEKQNAQDALKATEQRLRIALDAARMTAWEWDLKTGGLVFSTAAESGDRRPGTAEEAIQLIIPEDQPAVEQALEMARKSGGRYQCEVRTRDQDGRIRWTASEGLLIRNADGDELSIVGVSVDVTERKESEEAILESESRFRLVSKATNDAVWDWDLRDDSLEWSDAIHTMFGYSPDEVENNVEWWRQRVHPDDRERVVRSLQFAIDSCKENWSEEYRFVRADGIYSDVLDRGYLVQDVNHVPVRMIGAMMDITPMKKAELAIQTMNQELEQRVRQRTAELQAANQELEGFSYSIAHDMRKYLRSIVIASRTVIEDYGEKVSGEGRQSLLRLERNAKQAADLVDGLLEFTRLARHEIMHSDFDFSALCREVATQVERSDWRRHVDFEIQPKMRVDADPRLMRLVVQNLIDNACKYQPPGGVAKVSIGSYPEGDEAVFYVRDNGIGFDMRYLDKLFQPFERLQRDTDFPGTGIGLANVKRIIEKHGGRVWAEGEPGKGATFYFSLTQPQEAALEPVPSS